MVAWGLDWGMQSCGRGGGTLALGFGSRGGGTVSFGIWRRV